MSVMTASGSGSGRSVLLAGLVGVADAADSGFLGAVDVGDRVTDEDASRRDRVELVHGLVDQMRVRFERRGVLEQGTCRDEVEAVREGVPVVRTCTAASELLLTTTPTRRAHRARSPHGGAGGEAQARHRS